MTKHVCICTTSPAEWGLAGLELGEFTLRPGHVPLSGKPGSILPVGARITYKATDATAFGAQFEALITWFPMHVDSARKIRELSNWRTRIGLGVAVEAITAMGHGNAVLDALRNSLLPLAYQPPVDYFAPDSPPWPSKPHAMAIDFEHRPDEVFNAVKRWLRDWVRPLELQLLFYDTVLRYRYWGRAPRIPQITDPAVYAQVWDAIVAYTQQHVAPVWGHNSGVGETGHQGDHAYRVEEHHFRKTADERATQVADAVDHKQVLVRAGEWRDIAHQIDVVRKEIANAPECGAWVVSARAGGAFGIWT